MHLIEKNKRLSDSSINYIFGDAYYKSPEQRLGQNIDVRSDLYSLGCLMYETISGKPALTSQSAMETTYKPKNLKLTNLEDLLPAGPYLYRYQLITNKLLSHKINHRYETVSSVYQDLKLIEAAKEKEWQKKANVLKRPLYQYLIKYPWQCTFGMTAVMILLFIAYALFMLVEPYNQAWIDKFIDDNKIWLIQTALTEKTPLPLLRKKDYLVNSLAKISKQDKSSPVYVQTFFAYVQNLLLIGHFNEAVNKINELKKIQSVNKIIDPAELSTNQAFAQYAVGNLLDAEQEAKLALSLCQKPEQIESKISALKILGDLYSTKNDITHAEDMYRQMYELAKSNRLKNAPEYAYADVLLADTRRKENKLKESEQLYKEALDWGRNYVGHYGLFMAKACYGLALVYYHKELASC